MLTDQELALLVAGADDRKRRGESAVETRQTVTGYTLQVHEAFALSADESRLILTRAGGAKTYRFADLLLVFADGQLVKNHLTLKDQGPGAGGLVGGPIRVVPREF